MTTRWDGTTWRSCVLLAGLGAVVLPGQAQQRISLTDLQNQIAASVTCPAALPGQPRFVDKGDGTVCDSATGLMWEKKVVTFDPTDPHSVYSYYTWSGASSPTEPNGTLFREFLAALNNQSMPSPNSTPCFAGHCDWRIPTAAELQSILTKQFPLCTVSPCIDPIFGATFNGFYWSSNPWSSDPTKAFAVTFDLGLTRALLTTDRLYARAVRAGR